MKAVGLVVLLFASATVAAPLTMAALFLAAATVDGVDHDLTPAVAYTMLWFLAATVVAWRHAARAFDGLFHLKPMALRPMLATSLVMIVSMPFL